MKDYVRIDNQWKWGHSITIIDKAAMIVIEIRDDCKNCAFLCELKVHPELQRQGIATKLMNICEEIIYQEYTSEFISLYVEKDVEWLVNWYKKLGYSILWDQDEIYYRMIKKLTR